MDKKTDKNIILSIWNALGVTIIISFFVFIAFTGGSSGLGYQDGEKFFVGNHGKYVEVSEITYRIGAVLEILFYIFIPLTPIGAFTIEKIQEKIERRKKRLE